jgi:hypothetical protein
VKANTKKKKAQPTTTVTLSVPTELLRSIDEWASLNYPGIKVREKAMLYLIEMALEKNDGTSVDLDRG